MDKRVQEMWANALESGEFKQAKSAMKIVYDWENGETEYCCLGVLCELYDRETGMGVSGWRDEGERVLGGKNYSYFGGRSMMPDVVVQWAGLDNGNPVLRKTYVGGEEEEDRAVTLNDSFGLTFPEIAALVRKL
jgi:hypothetical protein